jgi:shikimate kinase
VSAPASTPDPRHVVLVGMMATGKTSVGRLVADALARPLFDSDAQIEARTGRTVREIWRTDGEPTFRVLEAEVLADALASPTPAVIAAAGGIVLADGNRARLRASDALVVWMRARPGTLLDRLERADDTHRPLLDADPEGTLERMHDARTPLYAEVADCVLDVDDRSTDDIAAEILAMVRT